MNARSADPNPSRLTRGRIWFLLAAGAVLAPTLSRPVTGQPRDAGPTSGIRGKVLDAQGRPLPGAGVLAWTQAAGSLRDQAAVRAVSDETGRFELATPFPAARYTVYVRKAGYWRPCRGIREQLSAAPYPLW